MEGQIIKLISDNYYVKNNDKLYMCKCRGLFRKNNISPLVGDYVIFNEIDNIIKEVLPRRNELIRPPICNIDQAMIVISVKKPDFDTNLLDKLLTIIEYNHIKPIICLTKLDLLKDPNEKKMIRQYLKYYRYIGYKVYTNKQLFRLKNIFKHRVTVFTGQSGVGKSTLLNFLDKKLSLKTNEISTSLGRGKHTTRHVELLSLCNGLIADTPGFSALDFIGMTKEDIRNNFIEFNNYKHQCQYQDCFHINEQDCAIKKAITKKQILLSRYNNYKKFINEK